MTTTSLVLLVTAIVAGLFLFSPPFRRSKAWQATVTPLASIIGSGFLVIVPLLGSTVGRWSWLAMLIVVLAAYGIGAIMRFNIRYVEPRVHDHTIATSYSRINILSNIALGAAYVISVTFYIRLLASFLLEGVGMQDEILARGVATIILLAIGITGILREFSGLEILEEFSVSIKISIIAALLVGLALFNFQAIQSATLNMEPLPVHDSWWHIFRVMGGMLLVVQGFETSRYLGHEYDGELRIRTMRWAQIIAGVIYIAFVLMATALLDRLPEEVNETAIIDLVRIIAPVLPAMLIVAATMSQFSAAVADTVGAGGLLSEVFNGRISLRYSYAAIVLFTIILIWTADTFQIIALASRAFALYYYFQSFLVHMIVPKEFPGRRGMAIRISTGIMQVILVFVIIFAIPAG